MPGCRFGFLYLNDKEESFMGICGIIVDLYRGRSNNLGVWHLYT